VEDVLPPFFLCLPAEQSGLSTLSLHVSYKVIQEPSEKR